ncbi:SDR family NAD(P)-dependent oxidoreductase [Paenibacillus paeoniae]|uniref:SDR family NAD(P)-dependent oxidoreductase n=1 Tax=Paenibacillus paeoniae TaxID=2292705 RepID=A0A371P0U7_9BACL|nr:SDR family oxidoreductase [Paenibacillus paeoniae]REK69574.1 SDR family NAD(P)-dependent oxidoreductase [Paenibacillus paeoniae]
MKYALVTGSTAGIGLAIAKRLLEEGCFVFVNFAHSEENAQAAKKILSTVSSNYAMIKADMSKLEGVNIVGEAVSKLCPQLDYLILNSYVTDKTDFLQVTPEQWQHVMDMNVNMPFFLMQRLYDHMAESGSVVCIGAVMGIYPHAISVSYGVSKAALHMLCRSMVKIYESKKVRINAVCPGFVETPAQAGKAPDHRQRIENKIALHRFAQPKEIADFCFSVLNNGYINGAVIPIDGGYDMA